MNASIQTVYKQVTIRFVFNKLNESRIMFLRIFATRNFLKHLLLRIVFCFKCDYARNLSFRTLCFSSSVFSPQREYIALLAKSLQAPREYLFYDATAKRRNKRDEHPTICLGETPLSTMRPPAHCFASKRSSCFNLISTPPNPLRFILSLFRNVGRHFCSRAVRIDITVYLFYSDDGNRSSHCRLEYS